MRSIELRIYTRPGCHLCEDMKRVVAPIALELGCELQEMDISGDVELEARFGDEIPVLFVAGRKAFKYRLTEPELRRHLQAARQRQR